MGHILKDLAVGLQSFNNEQSVKRHTGKFVKRLEVHMVKHHEMSL